jgi:hypothetical protein
VIAQNHHVEQTTYAQRIGWLCFLLTAVPRRAGRTHSTLAVIYSAFASHSTWDGLKYSQCPDDQAQSWSGWFASRPICPSHSRKGAKDTHPCLFSGLGTTFGTGPDRPTPCLTIRPHGRWAPMWIRAALARIQPSYLLASPRRPRNTPYRNKQDCVKTFVFAE